MASVPYEPDSLEIKLLMDAILDQYGYDFHGYSEFSFKRRLIRALSKYGCENVSKIRQRLLTEPWFFSSLLSDLTVTVSEMFRDSSVYKIIREQVFPYLRTYPEIKIWFAGCAEGQEVYSLAILLEEEGLYERSILYGTDINPAALKIAKEGVVDLNTLKEGTQRYFEAGGKGALHSYYTADYGSAVFISALKRHMVFANHSLVSDGVFGEMQLIFCRNALIYFKQELHNRAIGLFQESLCPGGFLCLGTKESLMPSRHRNAFEEFSKSARIYRKKKDLGA